MYLYIYIHIYIYTYIHIYIYHVRFKRYTHICIYIYICMHSMHEHIIRCTETLKHTFLADVPSSFNLAMPKQRIGASPACWYQWSLWAPWCGIFRGWWNQLDELHIFVGKSMLKCSSPKRKTKTTNNCGVQWMKIWNCRFWHVLRCVDPPPLCIQLL